MRLIDAEMLMNNVAESIKTSDVSADWYKGVCFVMEKVSKAPTIDPEYMRLILLTDKEVKDAND